MNMEANVERAVSGVIRLHVCSKGPGIAFWMVGYCRPLDEELIIDDPGAPRNPRTNAMQIVRRVAVNLEPTQGRAVRRAVKMPVHNESRCVVVLERIEVENRKTVSVRVYGTATCPPKASGFEQIMVPPV